MVAVDPTAELASRDVVVRGMVGEMRAEDSYHVYWTRPTWTRTCWPSASPG